MNGPEQLSWIEILALDPSLQDLVDAEIARAGIENDSLRWQRRCDKVIIAGLAARLEDAQAELRALRRRLKLPDDPEPFLPGADA